MSAVKMSTPAPVAMVWDSDPPCCVPSKLASPAWNWAALTGPEPKLKVVTVGEPRLPLGVVASVQLVKSPVAKFPLRTRFAFATSTLSTAKRIAAIQILPLIDIAAPDLPRRANARKMPSGNLLQLLGSQCIVRCVCKKKRQPAASARSVRNSPARGGETAHYFAPMQAHSTPLWQLLPAQKAPPRSGRFRDFGS